MRIFWLIGSTISSRTYFSYCSRQTFSLFQNGILLTVAIRSKQVMAVSIPQHPSQARSLHHEVNSLKVKISFLLLVISLNEVGIWAMFNPFEPIGECRSIDCMGNQGSVSTLRIMASVATLLAIAQVNFISRFNFGHNGTSYGSMILRKSLFAFSLISANRSSDASS